MRFFVVQKMAEVLRKPRLWIYEYRREDDEEKMAGLGGAAYAAAGMPG
jgi:hypothetical protein